MNSLKQILEDVKIEGGSEKKGDLLTHGSYRWIIMLGKCGRPDVFHLKWIIGTHGNWKKIKILEVIMELTAKQHCQSSSVIAKLVQMGLVGSAV